MSASYTPQPWDSLRRFTDARIALGRAGHSLPTAAHLQFQLAHAQARDAVHVPLDTDRLVQALQAQGFETLKLYSAAPNRHVYLQRPDLGRRLDEAGCSALQAQREQQSTQDPPAPAPDVCFVVADGLSALAIHSHAIEFLQNLLPQLQRDANPWRVAPVCVVEQGRVAIGDDIGERLAAKLLVVLIGERPGLSSPDSLGIYVTWAPRVGCTDAERNCISNVRGAGLATQAAAVQLYRLMSQARSLKLTGVGLKVEEEVKMLALDAAD
jgi:ethanolamine ammonia-lyase small subunit